MTSKKIWPVFISVFIGVIAYKIFMGLLGNVAPWWEKQVVEILSLAFIVGVSLAIGNKFFEEGIFIQPDKKSN